MSLDQRMATAVMLHGTASLTSLPGWRWCKSCQAFVPGPQIEDLRPPERAGGTVQTAVER
jgi:hypothetical protein